MSSGDNADNVRERAEAIDEERVHLKKLANWINSTRTLVEQLPPYVKDETL